jgi:hypothetical protein
VQLTVGENHTCTLSASGQIRCWGYNKQGCLGVGSKNDPADGYVTGIEGTVRTITSGEYHTCAITTTGAVWCWGLNFAGQVGIGDASDTPIIKPVRIALDKVRALHMGKKTSCAETVDRKLYCWGDNTSHLFDRRFCELVAVFPDIGTLVASSRVSARRILLPEVEHHVYYRVRPRARRVEVLSFWYAGRGTRPRV